LSKGTSARSSLPTGTDLAGSPHMKKLYGDSLRKDGGVSKTLKNVAEKHAKSLESKAGKHAPEIKRVMSGVKETMNKMEDKVTEAVEEFLDHGKSLVGCEWIATNRLDSPTPNP
jgi:hypothetical protein